MSGHDLRCGMRQGDTGDVALPWLFWGSAVTKTEVGVADTPSTGSQVQFWDRAAQGKVFAHPLDGGRFQQLVPMAASVLDYGCGRGRLCDELAQRGYQRLVGVDYSPEMIAAAQRAHPAADFRVVDGSSLPFPTAGFDAALLFAVLTCIAGNSTQRQLVTELRRVLRPGGLLLVSDYPLQTDHRNLARYEAFAQETGSGVVDDADTPYGCFRLPDGGLVRHHTMAWFTTLFADFKVADRVEFDAVTMNGNPARIVQWWLRA